VTLTTKTDQTQVLGFVILYPYRWYINQPEDPPPKNRTACAILEYGDFSERLIVLVAISDRKSEGAIELTLEEMTSAGLSSFRNAYVHVTHYNLDRKANSLSYNPRQRPKGRLPRALTMKVAAKLLENIRAGRAIKITRE
jgi:hypothetical protein